MSPKSVTYKRKPSKKKGRKMMIRALPFLMMSLVPACSHHAPLEPDPVVSPTPPVVAVTPTPETQPPADTAVPEEDPRACNESYDYVEWTATFTADGSDHIIIEAHPAWGIFYPRYMRPVRPRCLDKAVGVGGPEWLPGFDFAPDNDFGVVDPSNPYRYIVRRGTRGRILACQQRDVGPACGKFLLTSFNEPPVVSAKITWLEKPTREAKLACWGMRADALTTEIALRTGAREANPLIRNRVVRIALNEAVCAGAKHVSRRDSKASRWLVRGTLALRALVAVANLRTLF